MTWCGNWGPALNHKLFSNNLIPLHHTLSNFWAPNFNWEILDDMQAEKEYMGLNSPMFVSYFKNCVMITNNWFWYFFFLFVVYLDSRGYIGGGRPVWVFKNFRSLFSFLPFPFSFLYFSSFFSSLSLGGSFGSGAPGRCPPMPPSRYATAHCQCLFFRAHTTNEWLHRITQEKDVKLLRF